MIKQILNTIVLSMIIFFMRVTQHRHTVINLTNTHFAYIFSIFSIPYININSIFDIPMKVHASEHRLRC